jgi:predicted DNA-binding protein with PD1-like motif
MRCRFQIVPPFSCWAVDFPQQLRASLLEETGEMFPVIRSVCLSMVFFSASLAAQETRREIVNAASTPAEDAKANSDKVPDVYAIKGQFDRILTLRFKFNSDLLAGLEQMVKQERIRNAVVLSAIGSVRGYHIHQVSNRDFPSKNMFVKNPTQPADVIGMSGYIMDGRIHAHITLATPDKAFGGHLEPGTSVFTFVAVTLGIMSDGVDFSRIDDKTYR